MESMKQANINALRVWGGGLFEFDNFYEMADRYGILLWHDHMFACNVYPIDEDFLNSVRAEVASNVMRLRHHPSILAWAGNNENEAAIVEKWAMWQVENYTQEQQIYDYKILTINTTKPIIDSLDPSRPFLSSSPSNGIETDSNGGVSKFDPNNQFYGDVHFYNEDKNLWKVYTFPIPRCATEFGVQSVPLTNTMTRWVNSSEWTYGSKRMVMRQHHPGGLMNNLNMVFSHFEIPYECDGYNSSTLYNCSFVQTSKDFLNDFAYLSQIHQAIAMQTESEHYRRYRSFIDPDGRGNTMCALYWQLNDIWAAPTWSSIDFDQNWKVLHYYVRRFFAPIIVSLYFDEKNQLNVYVVNDFMNNSNINYSLKLDILTWKNGFTPIYSITKTINVINMGSVKVDGIQDDLNSKNITLNDNDEFVIQAILYDSSNQPQSPLAILLPNKMKQISNTDYGDATISNVTKIDNKTYKVTLSATKIVPVLCIARIIAVH
uniref:beta-mannosidase n=1 Tax=Acrobeloides nanus TaxID=290746 RepID=A0A914CJ16_9BILA